MKAQSLIILTITFFLLFTLPVVTSTNLISKLQSKKTFIDSIINELVNSAQTWDLAEIKMNNRQQQQIHENGRAMEVNLTNFNCTSKYLSTEHLQANIHQNSKNKINLIEVVSSNELDLVLMLNFTFNYDYKLVNSDGSEVFKSGTGWLKIVSNYFNLVRLFVMPKYKELSLIDVKMKPLGYELDNYNEDVISLINELFEYDSLEDVEKEIINMIKNNLNDVNNKAEKEKEFSIQTRNHEMSYNISFKWANQPYLKEDKIVSFMEGSIVNEDILVEEDAEISEFVDFNSALSHSEQLFIHKKLIVDLFRLNYEKKLFIINQEKINLMEFSPLNNMDMQFLGKYYPSIFDFKPSDSKFYFEFYVNSVLWDNKDALIKYTFYFMDLNDDQLLIEFDLLVFIFFDVEEMIRPDGSKGINFVIKNGKNLNFEKFRLLNPRNVRFNTEKFYKLIKEFLIEHFDYENFVLFKNYETFSSLIESFDVVKTVSEGYIFYNRHKSELNFLG